MGSLRCCDCWVGVCASRLIHQSDHACSGGNLTDFLSKHYDTFITEEDIAQIAGAGLNWIRLPIPFWAIEAWSNVGTDATGATVSEPFLANVCWPYILRILSWCRKYGLRVNLDMHTAPGSQNGEHIPCSNHRDYVNLLIRQATTTLASSAPSIS